jgi:hypothetical protein
VTILPDPRPIHELRCIYKRALILKYHDHYTDRQVRDLTEGFTPAETFEKFLSVNGQPVFEEVLRL